MLGFTVPAIMPIIVVLPAPFRPRIPTLAPAGRVRLRWSITTFRLCWVR